MIGADNTLEQALLGKYSFRTNPSLALNSYNEYGFHIEKDLFDATFCDHLITVANKLSNVKDHNYKPVLMPHREDPIFLDAIKYPISVAIINELINGRAQGLQTQFFYCKPGTRGFSLHQDNFYVQASYGSFVSIWTALTNTDAQNGGLIVYPGSHKAGNLPVRPLQLNNDPNQDKNANNEETIVPAEYRAYHLKIPKCSGLFIHAHLVHGSNSNNSNHNRYALLNLYIRAGEKIRSGNSAKREAFNLT